MSIGFASVPSTWFNTKQITFLKPEKINLNIHFASDKKPDVSQANTKQRWVDQLTLAASVPYLLISVTQLLSPLISKQAAKQLLKKDIKTLKPWIQKTLDTLAHREKLEKLIWTAIGFGTLGALATDATTGFNTKQPSKLLATLLSAITGIGFIARPNNVYFRSLSYLNVASYFAGEHNDINNTNHPNHRREWSFQKNNLKTLSAYLLRDFKETFSLTPWKKFFRKESWNTQNLLTPQASHTAIGAQMGLLAFLSSITTLLLKNKGATVKTTLDLITKISGFTAPMLASIPIGLRAWQSREEFDNQCTLLGIPLFATGRAFVTASPQYSFLSGLSGIGGFFRTQGIRLTSKKTSAMANVIEELYEKSLKYPNMTAETILDDFAKNTILKSKTQAKLGKQRFNYLIQLLKINAQNPGTSLSQYLYPMTLSY